MNNIFFDYKKISNEALVVAKNISWKKVENDLEDNANVFKCKNNEWQIVVVDFCIENQGFPEGSRGYDGMITHKGVILRLTRDLAKEIFEIASSYCD